jgi:hypothetical protein
LKEAFAYLPHLHVLFLTDFLKIINPHSMLYYPTHKVKLINPVSPLLSSSPLRYILPVAVKVVGKALALKRTIVLSIICFVSEISALWKVSAFFAGTDQNEDRMVGHHSSLLDTPSEYFAQHFHPGIHTLNRFGTSKVRG